MLVVLQKVDGQPVHQVEVSNWPEPFEAVVWKQHVFVLHVETEDTLFYRSVSAYYLPEDGAGMDGMEAMEGME